MAKPTRFAANVLTLAAGAAAAQGIALLALPLLTRIYSPQAFGVFSAFAATTAIAAPIVTGRYELAITLPADPVRAGVLVRLAMSLAAAIAVAIAIAIVIAGPAIAELIGVPALTPWLWLVPVSTLLIASTQTLGHWHTRLHVFVPVSLGAMLDSIVGTLAKLLLAALSMFAGGLILGAVVGQFAGALTLILSVRRRELRLPAAPLHLLGEASREYKSFPAYDLPNALSYVLAIRGSVLLVSANYGGAVAGLFAFSEQLLTAPFAVLTNAYRQAFYPELAALQRERPEAVPERLRDGIHGLIKRLGIPFVLGLLVARPVVPLVFGPRWLDVATYVHILSPPVMLTLVIAPMSHLLRVLNRQDLSLSLNLRLIAARLGVLWVASGVFGWSAPVALLCASITYYLCLLANLRTMFRQISSPLPRGILLLSAAALLWYAYLFAVHARTEILG